MITGDYVLIVTQCLTSHTHTQSHPDLTVISVLSGRHGDSGYWPSDNNLIDMSSLNGKITPNAERNKYTNHRDDIKT